MALPPCGLYRTRRALGAGAAVPAQRLVYFHNHGEPGPGLYLPHAWVQNRAQWHPHGIVLASDEEAEALEPLPPEGYYQVTTAFECCERKCRTFEVNLLVQLGYTGEATPLLFVPEVRADGLFWPERGSGVDPSRFSCLRPLRVQGTEAGQERGLH